MLNADDEYTRASVSRLRQVVHEGRPVVVWVGAGAGRWANLPSWRDSALQMRSVFAKSVPGFPTELAVKHIESQDYPEFFEICKARDETLFNRTLIEQISSPTIGRVYEQLAVGLRSIAPERIVTTNIDLCLEQTLGIIDVIERSDIERCSASIIDRKPFVAKLHGSVSAIQSVVFATSQFQQIIEAKGYIAAVKSIFELSSVLFLGYGLKDDYVLKLLAENDAEHRLFGNGPHFLLTSQPGPAENGVHKIGYKLKQHEDHRALLTVLNVISQERNPTTHAVTLDASSNLPSSRKESGFYISDFRPSGTYTSGQALGLKKLDQFRLNALVGLGFVPGELPNSETVAFHDLAVGLTCFDRVFLPLDTVGAFHAKATSEVFFALMRSGSVKLVDIVHQPVYVSVPESLIGDVGVVHIKSSENEETRTSMSIVRRMLSPAPGKEAEGNALIEELEPSIVSFADSELLNLAGMVRSGLLLPRVSQLLGFSDYSVPNAIPRWLAYPTLRFAHLVQTGLLCNRMGIRAARVPFGGESLLSAAFGIEPGALTAYDYASFVMAGAYGSNLSSYIETNPNTLLSILQFRESAEGESLRREIADRLNTNSGSEFSAAIEGSLKKAVPGAVLQAARNKFSELIKAQSQVGSADAVWINRGADDLSLWRWRAHSKEILLHEAQSRDIRSSSPCLCGSGDRFRDCCLRPLLADY